MAQARFGWLLAGWALIAAPALADPALTGAFERYLQPYVDRGAFSGAILVTRGGGIVFDKAYGLADAERHIANQTSTSFHIGSLSAQYTSAAVMMLVDAKRLSPDNTVTQFLPAVAGGDRITIGDLLARDAGAEPEAWRLLARIVEASTAKPLADVLDSDFFGPLFMTGSGLDDGTLGAERRLARGYEPGGQGAAGAVDWAARSGGGSAYTTTRDELRWIAALFGDRLVSAAGRGAMLEGSGWRRADAAQFGEPGYFGIGEAPGYAAFVLHLPGQDVTVVVLGNLESPLAVRQIGSGLAGLALGRDARPPPAP